MAKLTKDDILKLAKLARLRLSDDEASKLQAEVSEILGYVEILDSVNTENLEPTYQVTNLVNATRPDEVKEYGVNQESLLKNVPDRDSNYIKVKRMIG